MELKDILQQMTQQNIKSAQLTDLQIGTVTATDPLEITIHTTMAPLRAPILYLTSAVVEKKIPRLAHTHPVEVRDSYTGGGEAQCGEALADLACYENGAPLPVEDGFLVLNPALQAGDKVLLLRVQNGQKFVVLSRVMEV